MNAMAPSLTLVRRIKATPQQIYAAWTDPAQLARWWGPSSVEVTDVAIDPQVGGAYRIAMRGHDGADYVVSGVYQALQPPERLVFTWRLTPGPERRSVITVALRADGPETELTLTHEGEADPAMVGDRREGWTRSLNRLERHFA